MSRLVRWRTERHRRLTAARVEASMLEPWQIVHLKATARGGPICGYYLPRNLMAAPPLTTEQQDDVTCPECLEHL